MVIEIKAIGKDQDGNELTIAMAQRLENSDDEIMIEASEGKSFYQLLHGKTLEETRQKIEHIASSNFNPLSHEGRGRYVEQVTKDLCGFCRKYPSAYWQVS